MCKSIRVTKIRKSFTSFTNWFASLSVGSLLFLVLGNILIGTAILLVLNFLPGHGSMAIENLPFYKQIIPTLIYVISVSTNTGLADISPVGISRFIFTLEMLVGLILYALLLAKLASRKSEEALRQMHKMNLETTYRNIREDLYIVRRKLDSVMARTGAMGSLSPEDSELFGTACAEFSAVISEIPDLYVNPYGVSILTNSTDEILTAVTKRTLTRLLSTISFFDSLNINWRSDDWSRVQFNSVVTSWETTSPIFDAKSRAANHCYIKSANEIVRKLSELTK